MKELIAKIRSLPSGREILVGTDLDWPNNYNHSELTTDDIITLADSLAAYEELMASVTSLETTDKITIFRGRHDWCVNDLESTGREAVVSGYFESALEAFASLKGETNAG